MKRNRKSRESSAKKAPTLSRSHLPISIMPPDADAYKRKGNHPTAINASYTTMAAIAVKHV